MFKSTHAKALATLSIISLCTAAVVDAAAYQFYSQSANSLGYAHADMAALADDASTAWYNPAGMTQLCSPELSIGGTLIELNTEFNGKVGYGNQVDLIIYQQGNPFPTLAESLTTSFRAPQAVGNAHAAFPSLSIVIPLQDQGIRFALGLAIQSPWGLQTDYRNSSVRSYAEKSSIQSLQINPSIAIAFNELSIGVGYGRELFITQFTSSFVDFGAYVHLRSWDNTFNVGLLYQMNERFQVGLTYRPSVTHHQKGNASILFSEGDATSNFKSPTFLTAGFKYFVTPSWVLLGTLGYSLWSEIKKIEAFTGIPTVEAVDILQQTLFTLNTSKGAINLEGRNTVFAALGSKFIVNDIWTLKCGFAYDQSPVRTKTRELRIPDADHFALAVGTRCNFNSFVRADVGFEYVYIPKSGIRNNPILAAPAIGAPPLFVPPNQQGFNGTVRNSAVVFSLQISVILPYR